MATGPTSDTAAPVRTEVDRDQRIVLRRVPWEVYEALRDESRNDRIRMTYLDGTMILMSPAYIHDEDVEILGLVVRGVSAGLGLALKSVRTTTLRRGTARLKGAAKDPDNGYYIGDHVRAMISCRKSGKHKLDLAVDRPPDLVLEIDNTRKSKLALPIYARLGVPEVWRYDVKSDTVRFLRLVGDAYVEVERSVILYKLTPALVIQALDMLDEGEMDEYAYLERIRQWAIDLPDPTGPA